MLLIGDIHGLFWEYKSLIRRTCVRNSLQLGDFGLGFRDRMTFPDMSDVEGEHLFIRGNHDNPAICRADNHYVGDYDILEGSYIGGAFDKLFFISGAWSIDKDYRTPNVSWWKDEQLSYEELCEATNKYNEEKPEIVVSHDCPTLVLYHIHPERVIPTRTSQAMDTMFMSRKPKYWVFAHHHMSWRKNIDGCTFICLNEMETLNISGRIINIPQGE